MTNKTNATTTTHHDALDLGDDLVITSARPRGSVPGTWVCGTIHGHRFEALVFPQHASQSEYEIGDSRISKLWLQRLADRKQVYNFDRGLDQAPADAAVAAIVDFLAAGLAEHTFNA